ncbi:MAG: HD domain-containing protein [bacterium]
MDNKLRKLEKDLWNIMITKLPDNDPSHDREHIKRVLLAAKKIQQKEGGDLEIIIPAVIFHDVITYPKNDPRSKLSTEESAAFAQDILERYRGYHYPSEKITQVTTCILECSWSKGLTATTWESKILQDADRLEATGVIAVMRTFTSGGQMNRPLYNHLDPFCKLGVPEGVGASLDLFYQRLLKVLPTLHSKTAHKMATRRTLFLQLFLSEFEQELDEISM